MVCDQSSVVFFYVQRYFLWNTNQNQGTTFPTWRTMSRLMLDLCFPPAPVSSSLLEGPAISIPWNFSSCQMKAVAQWVMYWFPKYKCTILNYDTLGNPSWQPHMCHGLGWMMIPHWQPQLPGFWCNGFRWRSTWPPTTRTAKPRLTTSSCLHDEVKKWWTSRCSNTCVGSEHVSIVPTAFSLGTTLGNPNCGLKPFEFWTILQVMPIQQERSVIFSHFRMYWRTLPLEGSRVRPQYKWSTTETQQSLNSILAVFVTSNASPNSWLSLLVGSILESFLMAAVWSHKIEDSFNGNMNKMYTRWFQFIDGIICHGLDCFKIKIELAKLHMKYLRLSNLPLQMDITMRWHWSRHQEISLESMLESAQLQQLSPSLSEVPQWSVTFDCWAMISITLITHWWLKKQRKRFG